MTDAEREAKCEKHPEGGLRHQHIYCACDIQRAEQRGRETGMIDEAIDCQEHCEEAKKEGLLYAAEVIERLGWGKLQNMKGEDACKFIVKWLRKEANESNK